MPYETHASGLYKQAIAAAYAHRHSVHQHLTRGSDFPYPDEYGAALIFRFSCLPPTVGDLLPDLEGAVAAALDVDQNLQDGVHLAYVLGLGVLADEFNRRHMAARALHPPPFDAMATAAARDIMSQPGMADSRNRPRVAASLRQLGMVLACLYQTAEQAQRRWLGLTSAAASTPAAALAAPRLVT